MNGRHGDMDWAQHVATEGEAVDPRELARDIVSAARARGALEVVADYEGMLCAGGRDDGGRGLRRRG